MEWLMFSVLALRNGSRYAVVGSGMSFRSDLSIEAKPRIEEPSNICPSVNADSPKFEAGRLKCCCTPGRSVKRTSTNSTPSSLMNFRTSSELLNIDPPSLYRLMGSPDRGHDHEPRTAYRSESFI